MSAAGIDRWGVPVQAGAEGSVLVLDDAVEQLVALGGGPLATAERALALDHQLVLGHVLRAYLLLYGATAPARREARRGLHALPAPDGTLPRREALHVRAARAWAEGDLAGATRALGAALERHPRDLLALKVAQDLALGTGRCSELRDVVEAVFGAWGPDQPGRGYVEGMLAFGLEENGQYRAAEQRAGAALAANPRDVWAVHAMAHVYEMEGRAVEGIAFLSRTVADWGSSFFAVHNWWHRALFHLDGAADEQALALYDGPIRGAGSAQWLDLIDAAALLWRLSLFGVALGERAAALADDVECLFGEPIVVFNDWHAVMALGLAGRHEQAAAIVAANRAGAVGTNRQVVEQVGLGVLEGFAAFAAGRFTEAVDLLSAARPSAQALGGSHAQRDVLDLTLLAAACRAGRAPLVRSLVAERVARRPTGTPAVERLLAASRG